MYWVPRLPEIEKKPTSRDRVHDRHLATVQPILLVREDLAHHLDERPVPGDQPALLAVRREEHVAGSQFERLADSEGLLPRAAHVERRLALALRPQHPIVVGAGLHHRPQGAALRVAVDLRCPRAQSAAVVVEHADEVVGEVADLRRIDVDVRASHGPGVWHHDVGEVRLFTRARRRLGHVELQRRDVRHVRCAPCHHRRRDTTARAAPAGWPAVESLRGSCGPRR